MVSDLFVNARRRAVFLDRDGVLVVPTFRGGRSFAPTTLEQFKLYPEVEHCLRRLKDAGFALVVVTNQPDVGAGRVKREVVEEMHRQLSGLLPLDAIKTCFHTAEQRCSCRKPSPGLLFEAAEELMIDLSTSIMVGDRASDIEAGRAAGCQTVFIDLDLAAEPPPKHVDYSTSTLREATDWILLGRGAPKS
jgi:D-glycero-D-manno-heptose 1,7-bisphosphate phosphatase